MSFMNSALRRNKDLTLPSIEGGLGTMNIKKDKPKGIHTRRIIKVGEDMDIINKIEGSNDRNNEAIQRYARGVNPMVSVSYSNYGNNGGGNPLSRSSAPQSSLIVKILDKGAFRPPRDLLPIKRVITKPSSIITRKTRSDYSKRNDRDINSMREINKHNINILDVKPTKVFIKHTPLPKMNTQKYINDDLLRISATSGKQKPNTKQMKNRTSGREISDKNYINIESSKGTTNRTKRIDAQLNTNTYIQDVKTSNVVSNPKINIDKNDYTRNVKLSKNVPTYGAFTNLGKTGDKNDYTRNVKLSKNVPAYGAFTNLGKTGDVYSNNTRLIKLQPKIQPQQGIMSSGVKPWNMKENAIIKLENKLTRINKERYNLSVSRF